MIFCLLCHLQPVLRWHLLLTHLWCRRELTARFTVHQTRTGAMQLHLIILRCSISSVSNVADSLAYSRVLQHRLSKDTYFLQQHDTPGPWNSFATLFCRHMATCGQTEWAIGDLRHHVSVLWSCRFPCASVVNFGAVTHCLIYSSARLCERLQALLIESPAQLNRQRKMWSNSLPWYISYLVITLYYYGRCIWSP